MAEVKKTLPPSVGVSRGISSILNSCDKELDALELEARAACRRLVAGTADEKGCALWEQELGLDVREDLSLAARRALIRAALDQMDTCTPETLCALVNRMLEGEVDLEEDFAGYVIRVKAQVERFLVPGVRAVEQALRGAAPAHLTCSLTVQAELLTETAARRALVQGVKMEIYTKEDKT